MWRYSDELLDEIKSKNDIVDIVSQYVVLKRSGRNFFGLCPFHKEKSPSFLYHQINKYSIALDAELVEMFFIL